jgi:hypothetical protein
VYAFVWNTVVYCPRQKQGFCFIHPSPSAFICPGTVCTTDQFPSYWDKMSFHSLLSGNLTLKDLTQTCLNVSASFYQSPSVGWVLLSCLEACMHAHILWIWVLIVHCKTVYGFLLWPKPTTPRAMWGVQGWRQRCAILVAHQKYCMYNLCLIMTICGQNM